MNFAGRKDEIPGSEIKALIKAGSELKYGNLAAVTWDYEDEGIFDGKKLNLFLYGNF